jgi:hypothetical protein
MRSSTALHSHHRRTPISAPRIAGLQGIAKVIFVGSVAALVVTAPARAKNAESRSTDDKSTTSSCHAYQQAADGTWQQVPCQEAGGGQTEHKPPPKASEEEPR